MPKFIVKTNLILKGKIHEKGEIITLEDQKIAVDLHKHGCIDHAPQQQEQQEQKPPSPPAIGAPAGTAPAKPAATKGDVLPKS